MTRPDLILDELGVGPVWVSRTAGARVRAASPVAEPQVANPARAAGPAASSSSAAILPTGRPAARGTPEQGPAAPLHEVPLHEAPLMAAAELARPPGVPVEQLDWDALTERVAQCTLCSLCEKRTQAVFGVGDRQADWMMIGEAPGEHEDKQGEPFVGQAGKLLDNMLQALAMQRGHNVYIANVLKCRPPGNRNPEPEEVARCEPYLRRQVALVQPKLIVAMGRFAAQSLLKTTASIASLRGRLHEYENVPVIVTYHPAYLLRSLPDKAKAWSDLCLAQATYRKLSA
jgi:uracil-DNA glycosylase family 4